MTERAFDDTKQDLDEFSGGCEINLKKKVKGTSIGDSLSLLISSTLEREKENHATFVKKIQKWNKMYRGIKPDKNFPWFGAANSAVSVGRSLIETVVVRVFDTLWGQKKLAVVRAKNEQFVDLAPDIEDSIEWWQKHIAKLKQTLFSPILQSAKVGTGPVKLDYVRKKRTRYRYFDPDNPEDYKLKQYKAKNGKVVKDSPPVIVDIGRQTIRGRRSP